MKLLSRFKLIGTIGLIVAKAGCSATAPGDAPKVEAPSQCDGLTDEAAGNTATQEAEPNAPRALVGASLQKVCLDDEQRSKVETIGERVTAQEDTVARARLALRTALLEGLRAGQIDESALGTKIDALVKAREDASPVLRQGLEDLHGLLGTSQRAALTGALMSRMNELTQMSGGWLDVLANDIGLSDEQKQKIGVLIAKSKPQLEEERAQVTATSEQFKKDDFTMERIAPKSEIGTRMRARAVGMVSIAKELAAILSPKQRDELATKIEGAVGPPSTSATPSGGTGTAPAPTVAPTDQSRQAIVVARRGYRAGGVRGWGGRNVVVGTVPTSTTVVVAPTSGYVVGYPVTPGYGPGVW